MARPRVLVVEDDPEIRKLLRKYLDKLGLDVSEAGTGKSALAMLDGEEKYSLVCLDLMLPESSGYAICEHIRRTPNLRELPVLVISARSMPPDRALAEEVGANAYLIKPIRWVSFAATVHQLLGMAD
ncbi:MAG TPA: response regulator [Myxococcales bacterium]|nr:response regulator [Myxococcales bacterium]